MRVLVVKGPNAGKTLDMCTRQAESAIAGGWAQLPAAEDSPAVPSASVDHSGEVDVEIASIEPREETADVTPSRKPRRVGR